jgi:hypothetical protein
VTPPRYPTKKGDAVRHSDNNLVSADEEVEMRTSHLKLNQKSEHARIHDQSGSIRVVPAGGFGTNK